MGLAAHDEDVVVAVVVEVVLVVFREWIRRGVRLDGCGEGEVELAGRGDGRVTKQEERSCEQKCGSIKQLHIMQILKKDFTKFFLERSFI